MGTIWMLCTDHYIVHTRFWKISEETIQGENHTRDKVKYIVKYHLNLQLLSPIFTLSEYIFFGPILNQYSSDSHKVKSLMCSIAQSEVWVTMGIRRCVVWAGVVMVLMWARGRPKAISLHIIRHGSSLHHCSCPVPTAPVLGQFCWSFT